ncbi:SsrA-binding protein SmpB [Miniphocaeibacter massiliensis]|uniref:SsrA-binding protein SmpB n=1 Tax=Miniphocaeibacter massiliensis TaxID=2041841 RepID=UPI000C06AD2F|nr:SsrA-binding protein SmpB [Miniphocaeibacter massiliensis]
MAKENRKIIANNKKARHEYFIEESYEVGIVLKGTEVKSIRQGKVSIKESFCQIRNGELFIYNMHITPYDHGNRYNVDPIRTRKLLLHRKQINKLIGATKEKGYTIVPLNIYLKEGLIKMEIALGKGKKLYDKRDTIAKRDADRKIQRAVKERY